MERRLIAALLEIYAATGGTRGGLTWILSDRGYSVEVVDAADAAFVRSGCICPRASAAPPAVVDACPMHKRARDVA